MSGLSGRFTSATATLHGVIANLLKSLLASSSPKTVFGDCINFPMQATIIFTLSQMLSKEVIRPQVPLRPPCYDFSPLAESRFDAANTTTPHLDSTRLERRAVCARSRDVFTAR